VRDYVMDSSRISSSSFPLVSSPRGYTVLCSVCCATQRVMQLTCRANGLHHRFQKEEMTVFSLRSKFTDRHSRLSISSIALSLFYPLHSTPLPPLTPKRRGLISLSLSLSLSPSLDRDRSPRGSSLGELFAPGCRLAARINRRVCIIAA